MGTDKLFDSDIDAFIAELQIMEKLCDLLDAFYEGMKTVQGKSFTTQCREQLGSPLSPLRAAWQAASGTVRTITAYIKFRFNPTDESIENLEQAYVRHVSNLIPALVITYGEAGLLKALPAGIAEPEIIAHIQKIGGADNLLQLCRKKAFQPQLPQGPAPK